jgi:hypothetical protein
VQPLGAGRSRVQQFSYAVGTEAADRQLRELLQAQLTSELELGVSTQQGASDPGYRSDGSAPTSPAVAAFRSLLLDAEA